MERALFLSRPDDDLPSWVGRLYFGAEFCPWTFPKAGEILAAIQAARRCAVPFTLATPVIIEPFLAPLRRALEEIVPFLAPGDEILISDWGALSLVQETAPCIPVILGRVLSGQKRGPEILDLQLTADELHYFRQGSWYSPEAARFLAETGIYRVELDNLLQGISPLPDGLRASLHYPFAMVTSSRNCPFRSGNPARECAASCGEVFALESPRSQLPLLQRGNTQFLSNGDLPGDPEGCGIDRLVWHPRLPR
jgi:hypothetical protein